MLLLPRVQMGKIQSNLVTGQPSGFQPGTGITATVATNTKNASYTTLIATTTYETYMMEVVLTRSFINAQVNHGLVDIALGAAGSEKDIVSNLFCGGCPTPDLGFRTIIMPLYIPAGVRVSARWQSAWSGASLGIAIFLHQAPSRPPWPTFTMCEAINADLADSTGTQHLPVNSSSFSTWADIGAPTARDYHAIHPIFSPDVAVQAIRSLQFEIGIASTALAEYYFSTHSNEFAGGSVGSFPLLRHFPTGTQFMTHGKANGSTTTIDVGLMGFY